MEGIQPTLNLGERAGDGFFGGDSLWVFAILALMWGGNGLFGRGGAGDYARQSDVVYTSAFNQLQDENNAIRGDIQRVGYDNMAVIKDAMYNNLSEIRDLESITSSGIANQQKCCCDTLRAIDGVNYNGAINATTTAQTQKILDAIAQNKMEALQSKVSELQLAQAMQGVVRYPTGWSYNAGPSPFCPTAGFGY